MNRDHKERPASPLARWQDSALRRRALALRQTGLFGVVVEEQKRGTARCRVGGRWVTNFGVASAFGLDARPQCIARASELMAEYGVCSSVSRVYQYVAPYAELEELIAQAVCSEDAVAFRSATTVHCGFLPSLIRQQRCLLAVDERAHNTMHRAAALCAGRGSVVKRFSHNSVTSLRHIMDAEKDLFPVVMIDSVYSMSGEFGAVRQIHEAVSAYGGLLYVDDAHGTGVYGPRGGGYVSEVFAELPSNVLVVGSFSKALSGYGGFIACTHEMRQFIETAAEGFIFNGPIAAPMLGVDIEILKIMATDEYDVLKSGLHLRQDQVREVVIDAGHTITAPTSHIVAIPMADDRALAMAEHLLHHGILVNLALFPAVPKGKAVLRLTPSLLHTDEDIRLLGSALEN